MKAPLRKANYNGYIVLLREAVKSVSNHKLNFTEFGFYIALISLCNWDHNKSTYGCITLNVNEIASELNCFRTTVERKITMLSKLGYVDRSTGYLRIVNYENFTLAGAKQAVKQQKNRRDNEADLHASRATLLNQSAFLHQKSAFTHIPQDEKKGESFNTSFKGNLSLNNNGNMNKSESEEIADDFERYLCGLDKDSDLVE